MKKILFFSKITLLASFLVLIACQTKKEQYGDLKFTPSVITDKFHIQNDKKAPGADYQLDVVRATEGEKEVMDWVNLQFIQILFGEDYLTLPFQEAIQQYTDAYKQEYLDEVAEVYLQELSQVEEPQDVSQWYNYQYELKSSVEFYQKDLLVIKTFASMYAGGAHGMYNTNYFNMDLRSQKILQTTDIFKDGVNKALNKQIIAQLKSDYKTENLIDAMITEKSIYPTQNFKLSSDSITFCYTPYEIAAYAAGEIEVTLSWDQVKDLIQADQPIFKSLK